MSNFYYSGMREILVDFTNPNDSTGISNLYNSIKSDFTSAGISAVCNDTLHLVSVPNGGLPTAVISMNLGLGFGFYVISNNTSTVNISTMSTIDDFYNSPYVDGYGQTDVCLFKSRRYDKHTQTHSYENNSYGYDYHDNKDRNSGTLTDSNVEFSTAGQFYIKKFLTNYATDAVMGSNYGVKQSLWKIKGSHKLHYHEMVLPRYCYGRVNYSLMRNENDSWALYIYQTRPKLANYDDHPDAKRFGVAHIIFYDNVNKCFGWIMPQAPSPLTSRINRVHGNNCWAVLLLKAIIDNRTADISEKGKPIILDTKMETANTLTAAYPVFNGNQNTIRVSKLRCIIMDYNTGNPKTISSDFNIDEDIVAHAECGCRIITSNAHANIEGRCDSTSMFSMYRSYASMSDSTLTRVRSDNTTWEYFGNGAIHRIA